MKGWKDLRLKRGTNLGLIDHIESPQISAFIHVNQS